MEEHRWWKWELKFACEEKLNSLKTPESSPQILLHFFRVELIRRGWIRHKALKAKSLLTHTLESGPIRRTEEVRSWFSTGPTGRLQTLIMWWTFWQIQHWNISVLNWIWMDHVYWSDHHWCWFEGVTNMKIWTGASCEVDVDHETLGVRGSSSGREGMVLWVPGGGGLQWLGATLHLVGGSEEGESLLQWCTYPQEHATRASPEGKSVSTRSCDWKLSNIMEHFN